jgi:thiol-disulfide isomerase/thioredoxin
MNATVRAPEIDRPGLVWLNTAAPLSLDSLRGRLVILDFWTFCCINCIHVLPALRRVEERFPEEVVVIGVHSPKFAAEKDPENVARAVARYGVVHPVIHDPEFRLWRDYAVRAWPSLVFIDPAGREAGRHSGEADGDLLVQAVGNALAQYRENGLLSPAALMLQPVASDAGRLAFPGKIKPMPVANGTKAWVLADAGHHQIVVLDDTGAETARYGSGAPGFADGPAGEARFNGPQGLVAGHGADGRAAIFVADTGSHALRRIDLASGRVTTLAGNGRRGPVLGSADPAASSSLASPWDLELKGAELYFANAGTHQLGVLDLAANSVAALAGDGGESLADGAALAARLAQPSGLALDPDGDRLFFADSETSSVRALHLDDRRVETLVGTGLFDFGHANGPFASARLQHALGLCWWDGHLAVADSYNAAVRVLDLVARETRDLDDGFDCHDPVCLPLGEPAGIWADGADRLLVADTNNHRILEYLPAERRYRTWAS